MIEMVKKIKLGKVFIVVFLTALIWVWADLAQDKPLTLPNVVVEVAKSSDPSLWVSFVAEQGAPGLQTSVTLDKVELKGPASRVAEVDRMNRKGTLDLNLFLMPERDGLTNAGVRSLDVLDFLKGSDQIHELGLTVESCEPRTLTVRVDKLVKTSVPVECAGLDASIQATVVPDTVEAFVPKDEVGVRKATVRLTQEEQTQARNAPVEKTPYIELVVGQRRDVSTKVKVTLAAVESALSDGRVPAVLWLCLSQNVQGKYRVVMKDDDPTKLAAVLVKATRDACEAYKKTTPQMILYIRDEDRQATEPISREVMFNFPQEYLRRDEIRANQPPPKVLFTLEPIPEAVAESGM